MTTSLCIALVCLTLPLAAPRVIAGSDDRPHVVLIAGDEEYRSEETLPMLASILRRDHGVRTTVLFSLDDEGCIDPERLDHLPGTEILDDADLLVLFTRFRALPDEQVEPILRYAASGRPVVGLRTATHAFRYPSDHPRAADLNADWPRRVFGQCWITHHGHFDEGAAPLTRVEPIPADDESARGHPVMRGVGPFDAYSWLYHVEGGGDALPATATRLLEGEAIKSAHTERFERFPRRNPVAWTIERDEPGLPSRVFFTTLGHPYDFRATSARRLLVQGVLWAMGREDAIPADGVTCDAPSGWRPTNAGFGGQRRGRRPSEAVAEPEERRDPSAPKTAETRTSD